MPRLPILDRRGRCGMPSGLWRERSRSERSHPLARSCGVVLLLLAAIDCVGMLAARPLAFDTPPDVGHTTVTSSTISWVTEEPSIGRVRFGAYPGKPDRDLVEATPQRIHELRLEGLEPNTRYRYRVEPCTQGRCSGGFWTAPTATDAFSFVVLGDTRANDEVLRSLVRTIMRLERSRRFVFHLGDMVSDGESVSEWRAFFEDVSPLVRSSPFYSTLGNHDGADLYVELFSLPRNGPQPGHNYSFDWGNAHFTVIDSNKPYRDDRRQLEWLDQDLQRAQSATFRIVFFHHSGHGTRPERVEDHEAVSRLFDGILQRNHVSLVFNGHDHNYVHASQHGIDYVVTGGGGARLREVGPPGEPGLLAQHKLHHYCRVTVSPERLEVVAIDPEGRPIDSFVRWATRPYSVAEQ